ncbi:MAG: acyltransferase [Planctomycetes bacterium]|nr:acyltransferase [Planctomycetota bacterium]
MSAVKYRPEIDGLRAFAVLPIVLFHLGLDWIDGGYIGVDVFFVISGYLITTIVLAELDAGEFTLRGFWARRVRRILPALSFVTAATLAFAWAFLFRGDLAPIARQALAALGSFANIHFWLTSGDYWGEDAENSPFLHTWSLSVEEQFYVLFPLTVWLLYRRRRAWIEGAMLAVVFVSLGAFLWGLESHHEVATFYLLPTRAWELGTGSALAVMLRQRDDLGPASRKLAPLGLLGLGMIVISCFLLPRMDGGLSISILGTALSIAFARTGLAHRVLCLPPVMAVGKLSYSIYLWHWPVMVFARSLGRGGEHLAQLACIGALSWLSYTFVEQPTRRRPGVIPWIGAGYLATLGLAALLLAGDHRYDTSGFQAPRWCGLQYDLKPRGEMNDDMRRVSTGVDAPPRTASATAYLEGGIQSGVGDAAPDIVVLGDSHGTMWSEAIREAAERQGVRAAFYSMNAISPFIEIPPGESQRVEYLTPQEKYRYDVARLEFLARWKPALVILCARWSATSDRAPRDLLQFLEQHAGTVLILEQPPELSIGNRNALQYLCYLKVAPRQGERQYLPLGDVEGWERGRARARRAAAGHRNCRVLELADLYQRDDEALVLDGDSVVYLDDDHLTVFGTRLASARLEQAIAAALADAGARQK